MLNGISVDVEAHCRWVSAVKLTVVALTLLSRHNQLNEESLHLVQ